MILMRSSRGEKVGKGKGQPLPQGRGITPSRDILPVRSKPRIPVGRFMSFGVLVNTTISAENTSSGDAMASSSQGTMARAS